MKKIVWLLCLLMAALLGATGCGGQKAPQGGNEKTPKLKIVTTVFPLYDWTKQILGPSPAELTLLLDKGVDLHSYQPTAQDILKISDCDVFVYVGGESDAWVKDALREAANKDMVVVNLMDVLGNRAKTETCMISEKNMGRS